MTSFTDVGATAMIGRDAPPRRTPFAMLRRAIAGPAPRLAPAPERAVPSARHEAELIAFHCVDRVAAPQRSEPVRVLFVCRTHSVLSPMAEGLARAAFRHFDISVQSAGLAPVALDPRAVAAMAELGIDIARTPATAVRDLELADFGLVVSLGVHKLSLPRRQMALAWDIPEFTRVTEATARSRLRQVRQALSARVHALGAILTATNRA